MNKPKTLADKYLKDGVDVEEFIKEITYYIQNSTGYGLGYMKIVKGFLETSCKPTLTEDEKVILNEAECFQKGFSSMDKIHRTKDGDLYITKFWIDFGEEIRLPYKHLFQFIKPRRRI